MDYTKIEENITRNISLVRKKTGLNQENFFDSAGIGEYKTKINSGPGKANYISKLESRDSGSFPAALLPAYAKIGKCTIDDLFKDMETGEAPFMFNPVFDLAHIVAFNAYNACLFLEELYNAHLIDIAISEEGEVLIRIPGKERGFDWAKGRSYLLDDHFDGVSIEENSDSVDKILGRGSIIQDFLKKLKGNNDNIRKFEGVDPDIIYNFRSYLTEKLLNDVKEKEGKL